MYNNNAFMTTQRQLENNIRILSGMLKKVTDRLDQTNVSQDEQMMLMRRRIDLERSLKDNKRQLEVLK